ncbi:MAG: hypothetical protein O2967_07830 [Proteobacteria bacterium]|nr:hypothetical protein [Pseudomonadota bacterium]
MCDKDRMCACRIVVTRTYRELRARNVPENWAHDAAARIFNLHHPAVPEYHARLAVAQWLDEAASVSTRKTGQVLVFELDPIHD